MPNESSCLLVSNTVPECANWTYIDRVMTRKPTAIDTLFGKPLKKNLFFVPFGTNHFKTILSTLGLIFFIFLGGGQIAAYSVA